MAAEESAPPGSSIVIPDTVKGDFRIQLSQVLVHWHKAAHRRLAQHQRQVEDDLHTIADWAESSSLAREQCVVEMGDKHDKAVLDKQTEMLAQRRRDRVRHQQEMERRTAKVACRNHDALVKTCLLYTSPSPRDS
eukprot:TRINITY_DN43533_c0_g1_i2.p1 TRINITY_DN43533_c0_g1~~TRINITY_DN43533_c0_g1_i2.p1  ORF type:complete len:135 (+),score=49.63 TRINITY_DN43533_c0_g1_i2:371-775(+)